MGMVPHSGNLCSGMCASPCDHVDCWQCVEQKDKAVPRDLLTKAKQQLAMKSKTTGGLLGQMAPTRAGDTQTTTITRAALEGLAERAGVTMNWNSGTPIFQDNGELRRAEDYKQVEAQRLADERVKRLKDIVDKQNAGLLSNQAATALANSAAAEIDRQVKDILTRSVSETLKVAAKSNEEKFREELKAKGASDEDIAAAEALLGWQPGADVKAMESLMGPPRFKTWQDETSPLGIEQLKAEVARMKRANPGVLQNGSYIVHPDYMRGLDAELQSISGLNDLLSGMAPSQQLSSGRAISEYSKSVEAMVKAKLEAELRPNPYSPGWKTTFKGVEL